MSRLIGILFAVFIATTAAGKIPFVDVESITSLQQERIVGGYQAQPGQFIYQVSLRWYDNRHFCGGSILSNFWVLSVAHCTENATPQNARIIVGAHHVSNDGLSYSLSRVVNHPNFDIDLIVYDVSMLRTEYSIVFTGTVGPIAISGDFYGAGHRTLFSGWGTTSYGGSLPTYLQYFDGVTLTNIDCRSRHPNYAEFVHDDKICVYSERYGQGMCHGDSGGPLVTGDRLIGLACWVEPCARGYPDVSTRVSYHYSWITGYLAQN